MNPQKDFPGTTVARPFNDTHLDNILAKLNMTELHLDSKVKEFLVDMGNEFVEKVAKKSLSLNRKRKKFDTTHVKFVMKNFYDIEVGRVQPEETKK
jgi:hypothetical protein